MLLILSVSITLFAFVRDSDFDSDFGGDILNTSRITPLLHIDGTWQLIIAPYDFGDAQTTVTIRNADRRIFNVTTNGSVTSEPLEPNTAYLVSTSRNGQRTQAMMRFCLDNGLYIDGQLQKRDSTSFEVFNENGQSLRMFDNLFNAIDSTGRSRNSIAKEYGLRTVFRRDEPDAIFLFQHTRYIKTVYTDDEAYEFLDNHPYTYAILNNGDFLGANYEFMSYDDRYELGFWRREPWAGGYVYKVSYHDRDFTRATTIVELSQARFRKSDCSHDGDGGFNAFIFFAMQNWEFTIDGGIYSGWENDGEWRVFLSTHWDGLEDFGVIVESDYIDGEWIPRHDIEIDYSYVGGAVLLRVTNLGTGEYIEASHDNTYIGDQPAFIAGTAMVPDIQGEGRTRDWRNGGYLLNVVYRDTYLHRVAGRERVGRPAWDSIPFWNGNRESTQYLLRYNTDICTIEFIRDASGNVISEIINIDYRVR